MPDPKARIVGMTAMQIGAEVVVLDQVGAECARLAAPQATVWAACDGATDIAALAALLADRHGIAPDRERVFGILDALADAGLLERRVIPPARLASVPRRDLFARVMSGAAAALAVTAPVAALAQGTQEQNQKTYEEGQKTQEQDAKSGSEQSPKSGGEQSGKQGQGTPEQNQKTQERDAKSGSEQSAKSSKITQELDAKISQEEAVKSGKVTDTPEPASAALVASGVLATAAALGFRRLRHGQTTPGAAPAETPTDGDGTHPTA